MPDLQSLCNAHVAAVHRRARAANGETAAEDGRPPVLFDQSIKSQRKSLRRKLGAKRMEDAIAIAFRRGLPR
jgi:hypothetical protein